MRTGERQLNDVVPYIRVCHQYVTGSVDEDIKAEKRNMQIRNIFSLYSQNIRFLFNDTLPKLAIPITLSILQTGDNLKLF